MVKIARNQLSCLPFHIIASPPAGSTNILNTPMTSYIVSNTSYSTFHVIEMVIYMFNFQFGLKYGENSSKSALTSRFDVILSPPVRSTSILNTPMVSHIVANTSQSNIHVIETVIYMI